MSARGESAADNVFHVGHMMTITALGDGEVHVVCKCGSEWDQALLVPEERNTAPHDCDTCDTTNEACLEMVRERGRGCCAACYMRDTHGALRKVAN